MTSTTANLCWDYRDMWGPLAFVLVMDDFGIIFKANPHARYLLDMLRSIMTCQ